MRGPQRAGILAGLRHDHMGANRLRDLVEQRGAGDRSGHGSGSGNEMARPCIPLVIAVEAEPIALALHQAVEDRSAESERLGCGFALLLVFDRRQLREPHDLKLGSARGFGKFCGFFAD